MTAALRCLVVLLAIGCVLAALDKESSRTRIRLCARGLVEKVAEVCEAAECPIPQPFRFGMLSRRANFVPISTLCCEYGCEEEEIRRYCCGY